MPAQVVSESGTADFAKKSGNADRESGKSAAPTGTPPQSPFGGGGESMINRECTERLVKNTGGGVDLNLSVEWMGSRRPDGKKEWARLVDATKLGRKLTS